MALVNCPECGKQVSATALACPECGYAVKEHFDRINKMDSPNIENSIFTNSTITSKKTNKNNPTEKQKKIIIVLVAFIILMLIIGNLASKNGDGSSNNPENTTESTTVVKSGEEYETQVLDAFWEGASSVLGIQYSDFKFTHTACSYIQDFTTTDGYTSYYYLIETAYETENVFGKKVTHPITARCYYVPEYSNDVMVAYMTLDGEKVLFNEEKEDWLMGMGDNPNKISSESNTKKSDETTTQKKVEPTKKVENTTEKVTQSTTEKYNYFPDANDSYSRDEILTLGPEDFESEDSGGDLDGIVGQLPDDLLNELEQNS